MTTKDLIKLKPKGDPYSDEIRAKIDAGNKQSRETWSEHEQIIISDFLEVRNQFFAECPLL